MRLVGYDKAPARLPRGSGAPASSPEALADRGARAPGGAGAARDRRAGGSCPRGWLAPLGAPLDRRHRGEESDLRRLRGDAHVAAPGLVDAAKRNLARGIGDVGLFEVGPVVRRIADAKEMPVEPHYAAAIVMGRRAGWLKPGAPSTSSTPSGSRSSCCAGSVWRRRGSSPPAEVGLLHPGAAAAIHLDAQSTTPIGLVRRAAPAARARRWGSTPARSTSRWRSARSAGPAARAQRRRRRASPPRPATSRSGSTRRSTADAQRALLTSTAEPLLRELAVLEDYRDPKYTPPGKKGMLWTLTYRAEDRTLTDAEVDAAHARVVAALAASAIGGDPIAQRVKSVDHKGIFRYKRWP